jgi:vancomycin resistance protein YoaR
VPRFVRRGFLALAVLVALAAVVVGVAVLDLSRHDGRVLRHVTLAGHDVSGMDEAQLRKVVADVAATLPDQEVRVDAPGGGFSTSARSLGLRVVEPATARAALRVGRSGSLTARFGAWLRSFRSDRRAPLRVATDSSAVYATVAAKDPGPRKPPDEPSITYKSGSFTAVPGKPGEGIDAADVIAALPKAAVGGGRIRVTVDRGSVAPRFPLASAERLAAEMQAKLSFPLPVTAGKAKATVPVTTLRSWFGSEATPAGIHPKIDGKAALADLAKLLPDAGDPPSETTFSVDGGGVHINPGKAGTQCCGEGATAVVEKALLQGTKPDAPLDLPLDSKEPKLSAEKAATLGINEPTGVFTTKHKCCEPRVHNIHRIADILRGTVILPGQTFSVNDTVGKRTVEKGFVVAPVIANGEHDEDVGGGISQMATTLFNAAFFGGLDFGEYQSHSLYISRYPYGREATMGFPHPDLQIKNTTPYGILIWPTYTDTSLTVTLYSTHFVDSQQTGQTEGPKGACKRVTTERTRTYVSDGHQVVDHVFATYRPAEGVNC